MSFEKNNILVDELIAYHQLLLNRPQPGYHRFLYTEINWELRMLAIKGSRGVGKTTLLLQHAASAGKSPQEALYITADHHWFYDNTLFDLAVTFYQYGGRRLYIDEVHKYPNWSRELKLIYDGFPDMKVAFTSSSALDIFRGESDLSRRVISYVLPGLSFREYLELTTGDQFAKIDFDDLLKEHVAIAADVMARIRILPDFKNYLRYGYLPIFREGEEKYFILWLQQVISNVLETDLVFIEGYNKNTAIKVKRLLAIIAASVPFQPNIAALARKLDATRESVYTWLHHLEKALLINTLQKKGKSTSVLNKPAKIYLENTNLAYAFSMAPNIGNIRETFVFNQLLNAGIDTKLPPKGDFYLPKTDITIEVGGKNKDKRQIKDVPNAFLAKDEIQIGFNDSIPLWLFGFLY